MCAATAKVTVATIITRIEMNGKMGTSYMHPSLVQDDSRRLVHRLSLKYGTYHTFDMARKVLHRSIHAPCIRKNKDVDEPPRRASQ